MVVSNTNLLKTFGSYFTLLLEQIVLEFILREGFNLSLRIVLYDCNNDPRDLTKTPFNPVDRICDVYDSCSIYKPRLILDYDSSLINKNYLYIADWSRYYFIDSIVVQSGKRIIINASTDVLMSFNSDIKGLRDLNVARSQYYHNWQICDPEIAIGQDFSYYIYQTSFQPFIEDQLVTSKCMVLTTMGGVNDNTNFEYFLLPFDAIPSDWATNWGNYYIQDPPGAFISIASLYPTTAPPYDIVWNAYGGIYRRGGSQ